MMRPSLEGTRWLVGITVNASAAESYSVPIRVIGIISATARSLGVGRRGKPNARPAGSLGRRTSTTSAAPCTSPGTEPGERVILAIGGSPLTPALRIKTSQQRKLLVLLTKQAFSCAHRYKIS